jgi:hypothetical protein
MWSTSQKIKIFYTVILFVVWFNIFVKAKDLECNTCNWPSKELITLIDFSNNILDALKDIDVLDWKKYNIFWPWTWWLYHNILWSLHPESIVENIFIGTLKNFNKQQSYLRSTSELLWVYTADILNNWVLGFIIIQQPWPIVRDYQLLWEIDTDISNKLYNIGAKGQYWQQLSEKQLNAIKTIIINNSGSGSWKIFNNDFKTTTFSINQVLSMLTHLNSTIKKVMTLWTEWLDKKISIDWDDGLSITVNTTYIESLYINYSCVRNSSSQICGNNFKNFKENITNINNNFINKWWPKKSREKIETASQRLIIRALQISGKTNSNFYNNKKDDYIDYENTLLSSQWLKKRSSLLKWAISFTWNIPRSMNNILKNVKESWGQTKKTISTKIDILYINKNWYNNILSPQQINIVQDVENIINNHNNSIKNQEINSTDDSQEIIEHTLSYLRTINNTIYNNIKENLARTCELQCSNLGWKCR